MRCVATLWGVGALRPAPGTWGSAAAVLLGYVLHRAGSFPLLVLATVAITWIGWRSVKHYLKTTGESDPSEVIIDEVAGQLVALWPLSAGLWIMGAAPSVFPWPGWVGAFVMFRLFDIWKPWLVGRAERLPGATGVMADDLVAGMFAAIAVALAAAVSHGLLA